MDVIGDRFLHFKTLSTTSMKGIFNIDLKIDVKNVLLLTLVDTMLVQSQY